MEKLKLSFENCYGIEKLNQELDFSADNVITIYARNGLMKTSFSKTFKKIQENKINEVRDEIYGLDGSVSVKIDGQNIEPQNVFVIKSFENSYESNSITSLLIDRSVKARIEEVLVLKDKFLKILEKYSGEKVVKTLLGQKVHELEPQFIKDFDFQEKSFLLNIKDLASMKPDYDCGNIQYKVIFDEGSLKKIITTEFQDKINDFINKSDEIYNNHGFLEKGNFTFPKLKNIQKSLDKEHFFVKNNKILLDGHISIENIKELKGAIKEIEDEIKNVPEFKEIEKLLSDAKGVELRDVIENNPELISYLKLDQLDTLRKSLWLSYIKEEQVKFEELYSKYVMLETEINTVDLDETPWRKALNIFEERFSVPYSMAITNLKSSIIGDSMPSIEFEFKRNENEAHIDRNELERLDILSQGEKRALYLLNIIFDIEKLKGENGEKLLVIDDIADSFDYKNKYAIVEYLYEMSKEEGFYLIILSHNFDFYRTVSSRLGVKRKNRLLAEKNNNEIIFSQEKYQKQPFNVWKEKRNLVNVLALIPFVRNIIEYGYDKKCLNNYDIDGDYLVLTNLLHEKENTGEITFNDLKIMYDMYLGEKDFEGDISLSDNVLDKMYEVADRITFTDSDLEYKIILSMTIRHKAENIMLPLIQEYAGTLEWKDGRSKISGDVDMFMEHVANSGNQTRELYNAYIQFGEESIIKVLNEVNIMTPENIHLNSFMFEPILDMDIIELINLYEKVKELLQVE